MRLSPDQLIFWQHGLFRLNATIVFTWVIMLALALGSLLATRHLATGERRSRWQNLVEIIVTGIETQIAEIGLVTPRKYVPFIGTLFLFVGASSLSSIVPDFEPPTGSLSTTAALALCVFFAVPFFGIAARGTRQIPCFLLAADSDHAAVQHHQRGVADAGARRSSVRQHDERRDDRRHPG